jgi:6-phosphogluconolactonase
MCTPPLVFCMSLAMFAGPLLGQFVYVVSGGTATTAGDSVSGYLMNPATGALRSAPQSPFATGQGSFAIAADPLGLFVYVANFIGNSISGFAISSTNGNLLPLNGSPYDLTPLPPFAAVIPQSLAVDPSGKFLYVASLINPADYVAIISSYAINQSTGALTLVPGSPLGIGDCGAMDLAMDPRGKFIYISCEDSRLIVGIVADPTTGALTTIPGSPFDLSPRVSPSGTAVAVDPNGKYVYAPVYRGVDVFAIDTATGALTPVPGSPFPADYPYQTTALASVAVHPTGKFVYLTVGAYQAPGSVLGYTVDAATGALTPVPGSPFPTSGTGSGAVAVDPHGGFVYVTNGNSNSVSAFSINTATGALTDVSGSPFPSTSLPSAITVVNTSSTPPPPQLAVSVTPNSGSGASQIFAFRYSDSNGYLSLTNAYAGFGPTAYVEHSCRVEYYRAANKLYLKNDDGRAFLGPVTPGVAGTLSNSQCTLNAGSSSVSGSGNTLTLNLDFSFQPAFAGTQGIYMYAIDQSGLTSPGRQSVGTWVVPK